MAARGASISGVWRMGLRPPLLSAHRQSVTRRLLHPAVLHMPVSRTLFGLANPFSSAPMDPVTHSERKVLGYSSQQVYDVVSNVEKYRDFVPWVKESVTLSRGKDSLVAELVVGFPPVLERYQSSVTLKPTYYVQAVSRNGTLFRHLCTTWKIMDGPSTNGPTCVIDFYVSFEFKSRLHANLAKMFFDEVSRTMVGAFVKRCEQVYGRQHTLPVTQLPGSSRAAGR
eukprot:Opistho-2@9243